MVCKFSYLFTEKAERDLDEILKYITFEILNPIAAQNFGKKIFEMIELLRLFPDSGAFVDNEFLSDKSIHKLLVDNYYIYYKVDYNKKVILIVRIIYAKRNLNEILKLI